ncbi:MAG: type II toxin-antitoxin system VapC family toxin [Deltaproteobacteria bacterium]|nr:type II toxin-antitoxin system VapC family toxin [Deltaproteobacteria bacterium]
MKKTGALVVDSSAWIEILFNGEFASECLKRIDSAASVHVPTIVCFEVYRKIAQVLSDEEALLAGAYLSSFKIADLTAEIAWTAGDLSLRHGLATADALVLAHTRELGAHLLTKDRDFDGLEQVICV